MISKRVFLSAYQCLSRGWFDMRAERGAISHATQWLFWNGNRIGELARAEIGEGLMLPRTPTMHAVDRSREALEDAGNLVLFEASMMSGGCIARADAMRRTAHGWEIVEVKSGKSNASGSVKPKYLDDVAYNVFVGRTSGIVIDRATIMLIHHEYVLDAPPLFSLVDVTSQALEIADDMAKRAGEIERALSDESRPVPELIFCCKECGYFENDCVGVGVSDPLFDIPRLNEKQFERLKEHVCISGLPEEAELTKGQLSAISVIRSGRPEVDWSELRKLDDVKWPAYYLDFESIMPVLPWFEGRGAYDGIPFQYSIHVCGAPGREDQHHEYLASASGDWRRELATKLIQDLGTNGSIVVYSSFEKTQLNTLSSLFQDLKPQLDAVISRLFDLEKVFSKGYSHPAFRGRTSIKKVLPVMTNESYGEMAIADGMSAAGVFGLIRVGEFEPESHAEHRDNLLAYCKLDTHAMVRLHEEIVKIRESGVEVPEHLSH